MSQIQPPSPEFSSLHTEVKEITINNHHGKKVKHFRVAKELSMEHMARLLQWDVGTYSDLEKQEIIDDSYLVQIAEILQLGIEWLRDIPVNTGFNYYYQEGNGNYYQNYGDTHHNLYKPVDEVIQVCETTTTKVEEMYQRLLKKEEETHRETKQLLKETQMWLSLERKSREDLILKLQKN